MRSIRVKTFITVSLAFVGLLIFIFFSAHYIVNRSFSQFETNEMRESTQRALTIMENNIEKLNQTVGDWAPWDETYQFIVDRNAHYITSNLADDTLSNLNINFIVYVNNKRQVVFAKCIDLQRREAQQFPPGFLQYLLSRDLLFQHTSTRSKQQGFLMLSGQAVLIAAQPILTDQFSGPIRGTLIMGNFFTKTKQHEFSKMLGLPLTVHPYATTALSASLKKARQTLTPQQSISIQPLSRNRIAGYARVVDIANQPILLLEVLSPRDIRWQADVVMNYFLFILLVAGLLFGGGFFYTIERVVLARLAKITAGIQHIGTHDDDSYHLLLQHTSSHPDELDVLTRTLNEMLTALERSQQERVEQASLRESEARYRTLIELSPVAIFILSQNTCVLTNAAGLQLLGARQMEEVVGQLLTRFLPPERLATMQEYLCEVSTGELQPPISLEFVRGDDSLVAVEIVTAPFRYQGQQAVQMLAYDITERRIAENAIQAYQTRLRALASEFSMAEDRERRRIASVLHDQIGQSLVVSRLMLGTVKDAVNNESLAEQIQIIRQQLENVIESTRSLTVEVSPPILYECGLAAAIRALTQQFNERYGLFISFDDDAVFEQLPLELKSLLLNIIRELLHNVVKHANASKVEIIFDRYNACYVIRLKDNGIGFSHSSDANSVDSTHGFGLFSIRERLSYLGGQLLIETPPGGGTLITLLLPKSTVA